MCGIFLDFLRTIQWCFRLRLDLDYIEEYNTGRLHGSLYYLTIGTRENSNFR
jgi:hypothetical protein